MKRSKFFLLFGAIWLVVGVPFALAGFYMLKKDAQFDEQGIRTTAVVQSKRVDQRWNSSEKRNDTSYYITYSFTPEGRSEIQAETSTSVEEYALINEGQPIEIQYLEGDTIESRLSSQDDSIAGYLFIAMGSLSSLFGLGFVFFDLKARARTRRLINQGILTSGKVASIEHSNLTINNVPQLRIRYSFKDRMGRPYEGLSESMAPQIAGEWKEGDSGQIRYDQEDPEQSVWVGTRM